MYPNLLFRTRADGRIVVRRSKPMKPTMTALVLLIALLAGCGKESAPAGAEKSAAPPEEQGAGKDAPKGPAGSSAPATIPAGASVTIRTTNSLSTKTVKSGQTF